MTDLSAYNFRQISKIRGEIETHTEKERGEEGDRWEQHAPRENGNHNTFMHSDLNSLSQKLVMVQVTRTSPFLCCVDDGGGGGGGARGGYRRDPKHLGEEAGDRLARFVPRDAGLAQERPQQLRGSRFHRRVSEAQQRKRFGVIVALFFISAGPTKPNRQRNGTNSGRRNEIK